MEKNISWTFKQRQQYLHRRWVSVYSSSMHLLRFTDLCSLPPLHFSIGHWKVKCFNESPIDMIALDSKSDVNEIVWINRAIQQMHWYVATHISIIQKAEEKKVNRSIHGIQWRMHFNWMQLAISNYSIHLFTIFQRLKMWYRCMFMAGLYAHKSRTRINNN